MKTDFLLGVDVGTGSVRAGLFDLSGTMVSNAAREIRIWKPKEDFVEQSSDDIWRAAGDAVRDVVRTAHVDPAAIIGISFDATCSLVVLDPQNRPMTVSPTGNSDQNVIVWMDHRAVAEAEEINATRHRVLRFVGGKISPEMEPPKLLWLKRNMPSTWKGAAKFLDLADFMTFRSTGVDIRSLCTTVCKWTYDGERGMWDRSFFEKIGLRDLLSEGKIGEKVLPMGTPIGPLSTRAAAELGLTTRTMVAVGIIDAHAGGVGMAGMGFAKTPTAAQLEKVLALIGGTSSCHMAVSKNPRYIKGIWGPYPNAMIPGLWLTEGGQSATGSLLDHMIRNNAKSSDIVREAERQRLTVYEYLNAIVARLQKIEGMGPEIAKDINILPYFLGNRSPNADPHARGIVSGVTLDESPETAARLYYATIQSIAYGTRHIIEEMNRKGYRIRRIHACGGGTKNPVWLQEHADVTGCEIILPGEPEAVLLGTAMLAAVGAGVYPSIQEASFRMGRVGATIKPRRIFKRFHDAKYKVFRKMYADFKNYREMMEDF